MSKSSKKQTQSNYNTISSDILLDDGMPRMVIDQNDQIIFCNHALHDLCGNIEGGNINDVFDIEDIVNEGTNQFILKQNKQALSFQINQVQAKNGESFLVASTEHAIDPIERPTDDTPFIELSFDACCVASLDGKFLNINQNFSNLLGYDLKDLEKINLFDVIAKNHQEKFTSSFKALQVNGEFSNIEVDIIDKQGSTRWLEWKHKIINNKLYCSGRDLTPLRSYKESFDQQKEKLEEAEAIGHLGRWEWKVGSDNIFFSDQLYRIFGVEKSSFKPTLKNITDMIDRRDSGRMMQVFQRAIIEQNDYDMDFRLTTADGKTKYIKCEGRCTIDQDDDVTALYGIMQDVTHATQKELDLLNAKDCVERAYAAKTQFLANMSHELRTPLNAIIGFSEMIERQLLGPIGTEKYLEYIGGIRQSGEHLLDLISDILDMSKIEAGKYELNLEKFNIAKIIRMAAHMMEGRALDAEIKINLDIEDDQCQIVADRRAVMQMILNLLSNAVKFSHKQGCVTLKLMTGKRFTHIIVEDKGIGIPANKLANITMPFEQAETDYTREYEGSGLGLAITKELTEIHGGNLVIESELNIGTTVTIKLPLETKK